MAAANASVLPPAPAQISSTCCAGPGAGHQRGDLRALVLHLVPALAMRRLRSRRWAAAPAPSGAGRRTPSGEKRRRRRARSAPAPSARVLPVGLQRVDAQIDRRPARQGCAFLGGRLAECALRTRAPAIRGCRPRTAAAVSAGESPRQPGPLGLAQRLHGIGRAVGRRDHASLPKCRAPAARRQRRRRAGVSLPIWAASERRRRRAS